MNKTGYRRDVFRIPILLSKLHSKKSLKNTLLQSQSKENFLLFSGKTFSKSESWNFAKSFKWQVNVKKRTGWGEDFRSML